jgi:hypothetical protein
MLQRTAVILSFCLTSAVIFAGEPLYVPHGAGEMAIAFASSATPGHWSCFHNQALLTSRSGISAACALETRFMLPALSSKAISAIISVGSVPIGIIATHYGNGDYFRIFTGLGSAVTLTKKVSLGVQADFISEQGVGDYRDISHITFETGMAVIISPSLTLGMHLFNPLVLLNTIPSSLSACIEWRHSDALAITFGSSIMTEEPLSVQGGIRWKVLDRMILRTGYMSAPSSFTFGAGFLSDLLEIDAGFMINSVTGITSSVSFVWSISMK